MKYSYGHQQTEVTDQNSPFIVRKSHVSKKGASRFHNVKCIFFFFCIYICLMRPPIEHKKKEGRRKEARTHQIQM
jgi:hypothetical protein